MKFHITLRLSSGELIKKIRESNNMQRRWQAVLEDRKGSEEAKEQTTTSSSYLLMKEEN